MTLAHPQNLGRFNAAQLPRPITPDRLADPSHPYLPQHPIPPAQTGQILCYENRTYPVLPTVLRHWYCERDRSSVERGQVSRAIEDLGRHGVHVYAGRFVRLCLRGPDETGESYTSRVLAIRFATDAGLDTISISRMDERIAFRAESDGDEAREKRHLDWAGLETIC